VGLLQDGAWLRHAKHANAMARRLRCRNPRRAAVNVAFPVETNAVFATIPNDLVQDLHQRAGNFTERRRGLRAAHVQLGHEEEDVDTFAADLKRWPQSNAELDCRTDVEF